MRNWLILRSGSLRSAAYFIHIHHPWLLGPSLLCAMTLGLPALLAGCGGLSANQAPAQVSAAPTEASTGLDPATPPSQRRFTNIQQMPNWNSCTLCTGGPPAVYSMVEGIVSPSLSGASAQFSISGSNPWGQALWWKQIGGNDSASHFLYELYFSIDNPGASQALEFNVNQNARGRRFEYVTQCDLRGSHTWRVFDFPHHQWASTGVSCPPLTADTWHHLVWEFQRTPSNQVLFQAVTLDGNRGEMNMTIGSLSDSGSGIDVAFQMDEDGVPTPYNVWLDKVFLTYW